MGRPYAPDPQITVDGIRIDLRRKGSGRPLLFLQGLEGWIRDDRYFDLLARDFDVLAPAHPGRAIRASARVRDGRGSGAVLSHLPRGTRPERRRPRRLVVRGWVAAELAVRSTDRLAALVLVDSLGIKVGGREDRDITDIYALPQSEVASLLSRPGSQPPRHHPLARTMFCARSPAPARRCACSGGNPTCIRRP